MPLDLFNLHVLAVLQRCQEVMSRMSELTDHGYISMHSVHVYNVRFWVETYEHRNKFLCDILM